VWHAWLAVAERPRVEEGLAAGRPELLPEAREVVEGAEGGESGRGEPSESGRPFRLASSLEYRDKLCVLYKRNVSGTYDE
jgi:hypothetical protein